MEELDERLRLLLLVLREVNAAWVSELTRRYASIGGHSSDKTHLDDPVERSIHDDVVTYETNTPIESSSCTCTVTWPVNRREGSCRLIS